MQRSASQVLEFAKCPQAFHLKRHEGAPQTPAPWAGQGSAVHHALLDVWEAGGRECTIREAQEAFTLEFARYLNEYKEREPDTSKWLRGGRKSTEKDIELRMADGVRFVEEYIMYVTNEGLSPVEIDGRPAVELPFDVQIGEGFFGEPLSLRGYIDALYVDPYGTLLVRDLKTGKRPAWDFQLWVYGYAVRHQYNLDVRWGDFFLSKENAPTPPVDLIDIPEEEMIDLVIRMDAADMIGYYNPNPGDACFTCDVKASCKFSA